MTTARETRDFCSFQILTDELPDDEPRIANNKIKRKLRRVALGDYDQVRVDDLRRLRDDLVREFRKHAGSQYYRGKAGKLATSEDYHVDQMTLDHAAKYSEIDFDELRHMVVYAINYHYLR